MELLFLVGRHTPCEASHRPRPSGCIFFGRNAAKICRVVPGQQALGILVFILRRANAVGAESSDAPAGVLSLDGPAGPAAPQRSRPAVAGASARWASVDTPRTVMSSWAPGGQPAAEGWAIANRALLLGAAALGLAATAVRARAGAPRMDLELGDMDGEAPLPSRGRHKDCAFCKTTEDRRGATSTCLCVHSCILFARHARSLFASRAFRVFSVRLL